AGGPFVNGAPIAFMSPQTDQLVNRLTDPVIAATADKDASVRQGAIALLSRIAALRPDPKIVPTLVKLLKDEQPNVRERAPPAMGDEGMPAVNPPREPPSASPPK